ncbi:hypothetical protein HK100_010261 [Physocladia obscura]|uniref:Uncharacterized protein n=1 Tax=Physocladia obscura TaxID=109957 RepID=A0AAD5XH87_9FUNG|nr:hypothetical protein HK100_010261 [Physocladia obscura]
MDVLWTRPINPQCVKFALQELNSLSGLTTRISLLQRILDTIPMDISAPTTSSHVYQAITSQIHALQGFRAVLAAQVSDLQKGAANISETTAKNSILGQIDALRFGDDVNDGLSKRSWYARNNGNNDNWDNWRNRGDHGGGEGWRNDGGNNWGRNAGHGWENSGKRRRGLA